MNPALWKNRRVLVTGGTGMIGTPIVQKLLTAGAQVRVASMDDKSRCPEGAEFLQLDLTDIQNCTKACKGIDDVLHVAGIKGSPAMTAKKPASFFYSTLAFNTHMLEAAHRNNCERFLFTSSVGVYSPAEVFYEDSVWSTFPSPNDKFAGWAKRMGELQLDAYRIQYDWQKLYCGRPANVYGPLDNFDPQNAMVIPSLIHRLFSGENPFVVWGDGSAIRDFIFAEDCADGLLSIIEKNITEPINLGSGFGISIAELVNTLIELVPTAQRPELQWDTSKPQGDKKRVLSMEKAHSYGIRANTSLKAGLEKTVEWYLQNKNNLNLRYNVFTK